MVSLFRVAPFVHLSHSHRISQSGEVSHGGAYFAGTDCEIATTTLHAVERAGMLDDMASVCSPAQFLNRRFPNQNEIASPSDAFDMACAVALCGDTELVLSTFHHARDMKHRRAMQFGSKPDDDFFLADINKAIESLGVGLDAFQVHIDRASQAAAATHGFCAPMVL